MAGRPSKESLDYYSHSVNSHTHWKFVELRYKYGWEGEGRFWALNNLIAASKNCRLPIDRPSEIGQYAKTLDMEVKEFDEFLKYLASPCELIIMDNKYISTQDVIDVFEMVDKKRKRNQDRYKDNKEIDFSGVSAAEIGQKVDRYSPEIPQKIEPNKVEISQEVVFLRSEVSKYFGYNEVSHFRQITEVSKFLNVLFIDGNFPLFKEQFENYKLHREAAKIGKHGFVNFLGSIENRFMDGAWNAENWKMKYEELKKNSIKKSDPVQAAPIRATVVKEAI